VQRRQGAASVAVFSELRKLHGYRDCGEREASVTRGEVGGGNHAPPVLEAGGAPSPSARRGRRRVRRGSEGRERARRRASR
jgi:hypothetical protein